MSEPILLLLTCPFCGAPATMKTIWAGTDHYAACSNILECGADGPVEEKEEDAAAKWNRRKP